MDFEGRHYSPKPLKEKLQVAPNNVRKMRTQEQLTELEQELAQIKRTGTMRNETTSRKLLHITIWTCIVE